jgi:hypothetical protein
VRRGPAGMAILEINRGDVRALSILTEEYATRVTGMQSTNRSADIAMVSRTGDPATGEFGDATVIRKFGDVPRDLSAL